jgi:hypothetical protein
MQRPHAMLTPRPAASLCPGAETVGGLNWSVSIAGRPRVFGGDRCGEGGGSRGRVANEKSRAQHRDRYGVVPQASRSTRSTESRRCRPPAGEAADEGRSSNATHHAKKSCVEVERRTQCHVSRMRFSLSHFPVVRSSLYT